jgi:hypothetical protein
MMSVSKEHRAFLDSLLMRGQVSPNSQENLIEVIVTYDSQ